MLALGAVELTKFLPDPAHEQGFNSTSFMHFWKQGQREGFYMSDLGEALVSSGGGRGGLCIIRAIYVCSTLKGMVFKQFTLG